MLASFFGGNTERRGRRTPVPRRSAKPKTEVDFRELEARNTTYWINELRLVKCRVCVFLTPPVSRE